MKNFHIVSALYQLGLVVLSNNAIAHNVLGDRFSLKLSSPMIPSKDNYYLYVNNFGCLRGSKESSINKAQFLVIDGILHAVRKSRNVPVQITHNGYCLRYNRWKKGYRSHVKPPLFEFGSKAPQMKLCRFPNESSLKVFPQNYNLPKNRNPSQCELTTITIESSNAAPHQDATNGHRLYRRQMDADNGNPQNFKTKALIAQESTPSQSSQSIDRVGGECESRSSIYGTREDLRIHKSIKHLPRSSIEALDHPLAFSELGREGVKALKLKFEQQQNPLTGTYGLNAGTRDQLRLFQHGFSDEQLQTSRGMSGEDHPDPSTSTSTENIKPASKGFLEYFRKSKNTDKNQPNDINSNLRGPPISIRRHLYSSAPNINYATLIEEQPSEIPDFQAEQPAKKGLYNKIKSVMNLGPSTSTKTQEEIEKKLQKKQLGKFNKEQREHAHFTATITSNVLAKGVPPTVKPPILKFPLENPAKNSSATSRSLLDQIYSIDDFNNPQPSTSRGHGLRRGPDGKVYYSVPSSSRYVKFLPKDNPEQRPERPTLRLTRDTSPTRNIHETSTDSSTAANDNLGSATAQPSTSKGAIPKQLKKKKHDKSNTPNPTTKSKISERFSKIGRRFANLKNLAFNENVRHSPINFSKRRNKSAGDASKSNLELAASLLGNTGNYAHPQKLTPRNNLSYLIKYMPGLYPQTVKQIDSFYEDTPKNFVILMKDGSLRRYEGFRYTVTGPSRFSFPAECKVVRLEILDPVLDADLIAKYRGILMKELNQQVPVYPAETIRVCRAPNGEWVPSAAAPPPAVLTPAANMPKPLSSSGNFHKFFGIKNTPGDKEEGEDLLNNAQKPKPKAV